MKMKDSLIAEFEREAQTTRKHLERLSDDKMEWRPHEKSFTAGGLASHIAEMIGWANSIINQDEIDIDPATYKPYEAASVAELLKTFEDNVEASKKTLAGVTDATLEQPFRFKVAGQLHYERPKAEVFRDVILSHVIHHRGQFSVYLRLLNIPVPPSYGPSADEEG
jgi:uncharacterized damage-inducible protein DinB